MANNNKLWEECMKYMSKANPANTSSALAINKSVLKAVVSNVNWISPSQKKKCDCQFDHGIIPYGEYLRGRYKLSSAYLRINIHFIKMIDIVLKYLEENCHVDSEQRFFGIAAIYKALLGLKTNMQTNAPFRKMIGDFRGSVIWDDYLDSEFANRWYGSPLIHSECYLYNKIYDYFYVSDCLSMCDYFRPEKKKLLCKCAIVFGFLARHMFYVMEKTPVSKNDPETLRRIFCRLLKLSLWADKYERICLKADMFRAAKSPLVINKLWKENVIVDQSDSAWFNLMRCGPVMYVDIVLAKCGLELFCDLCLAYFLVSKRLVKQVRLHVKYMPWACYDATEDDVFCTIKVMQMMNEPNVKRLGQEWESMLMTNYWVIDDDKFWTFPYDYDKMEKIDSDLYSRLSMSSLIIFKGELHHRKLIGDINWRPDTPFCHALGRFHPAPLVSLRVIEMEIVCGIPLGVKEELDRRCCDWMLSGSFGVILFDAPVCKKEVEPSCVCEGQNPVSFCPTCPTAQKCRENNYLECK